MANRNDAVLEILKLGFEFENAVARPEDHRDPSAWFLQHIYVPSLLDSQLLQEIKADVWDVVFLTGNPGDGKSAFMGRLNEQEATNSGRPILSKHDATEPADPTDRAAVAETDLRNFLEPLDDHNQGTPEPVFVVGINKGMLQRAILAPGSGFDRRLAPALQGADSDLRAQLVDLNQRSFADLPVESREDLFDQVLAKLTSEDLWEERACQDCEDSGWCPFFANTRRLRGSLASKRLKVLWSLQELRRDRHATMRDLLATLAYILVGHEDMFHAGDDPQGRLMHPCEFVEREKANQEPLGLFRRLLYNSTFRDDDFFEEPGAGSTALVEGHTPSTARTFGFAPAPWFKLAANDPSKSMWSAAWETVERRFITRPERLIERLSRGDSELEDVVGQRLSAALASIRDNLLELEPSEARYLEALENYRHLLFMIVGLAKRSSFFADPDLELDSLTPYRHLSRFVRCVQFLRGNDDSARDVVDDVTRSTLPLGLMGGEGLTLESQYPTDLFVRWSVTSGSASASLALHLDPSLALAPKSSRFVEGESTLLIYSPLGQDSEAKLELGLDEFELLHRLSEGFREEYGHLPRTTHVRNFRERLRAERAQRLMVSDRIHPQRHLQVDATERVIFQ